MKFTLAIATLSAMVSADVTQPIQSLSAAEINSQYEAQNIEDQVKVFHQEDLDNASEDDDDESEEDNLVQAQDDDEESEEDDDDDDEANLMMDDDEDDDEQDEDDESDEDDEDILTADE